MDVTPVWTEAVPAACDGWYLSFDGRSFTADPRQAQRRTIVTDIEFSARVWLTHAPGETRVMYACSAPSCRSNGLVVDADRRDEHRAWHQRHEDVRAENVARRPNVAPRPPRQRTVSRPEVDALPVVAGDDDVLGRITRIRAAGMTYRDMGTHLGGMPLWRARNGKSQADEVDKLKLDLTKLEEMMKLHEH